MPNEEYNKKAIFCFESGFMVEEDKELRQIFCRHPNVLNLLDDCYKEGLSPSDAADRLDSLYEEMIRQRAF